MLSRLFIFFAIASIVLTIGIKVIDAQQLKPDLAKKRITIQIKNKPIHDTFVTLMNVYDIPIGFEESTLDKDHGDYFFQPIMPPHNRKNDLVSEQIIMGSVLRAKDHLISIDFKDAQLEQVLDEIVRQMKNYDWVIDDGVVNIFPIKGRNPVYEKLLDMKVQSFFMSKNEQYKSIQPMIVFYLPEFKLFLAENKLHAESDRYLPSYSNLTLPEELRFTNVTFRQLLNGITKLKQGGWILHNDKFNKPLCPENKDKEVIEILI